MKLLKENLKKFMNTKFMIEVDFIVFVLLYIIFYPIVLIFEAFFYGGQGDYNGFWLAVCKEVFIVNALILIFHFRIFDMIF
jgi:hypothetical protein